jgi:glutaminase
MDRLKSLFDLVAHDGVTSAKDIQETIETAGIRLDDLRLKATMAKLRSHGNNKIGFEDFKNIVSSELLMINRVFNRQLTIPDWEDFSDDIQLIFEAVEKNREGHNADYIPILKDADPEKWGLALCTVDGQRIGLGDVDVYHSIQSVSKPITYAYALSIEGIENTHQYVGVEPSGRAFNALELLPDMRPFNPCVNAGAIMMAGLVASARPEKNARSVTQELMDVWQDLSGNQDAVGYSEETMTSERDTADNNYAIAYLLKGRKGLPRNVDLNKMIDVYLSCCSIEMTANMLSVAAATLANGGVCPVTGKQVFTTEIVQKTLAVMQAAGMYDNAGVFSLEVGLPAKSGVAGAVLVVVPNVMGFATFSPRLDSYGNSARGVAFCRQLVDRFTFHMYDSLSGGRTGCKRDPRASQRDQKKRDISDLRWAVGYGDLYATKVADLTIDCMLSLSMADGSIDGVEIDAIAQTYSEIMGQPADRSRLKSLAEERSFEKAPSGDHSVNNFDNLITRLGQERPFLDDNARELILESAFRVACSDGLIEETEDRQLRALANALEINEGVLELEIAQFQRELHAKTNQDVAATVNAE